MNNRSVIVSNRTCFALAVLFAFGLNCVPVDAQDRLPASATRTLNKLDACFNDTFAWWANVYDPESGGCFYSLSGKKARRQGDNKFAPDIEATNKLVNVLSWSGILQQTSPTFRQGVIKYMQSRQDSQSGFFRDPEFRNNYSEHKLNRAVGMATNSLTQCGGTHLYPLPFEQVGSNDEAAEHFAHLANPDALTAWLNKQPWEKRVWTCGSHIRSQSETFVRMEPQRREQLLKTVESFLRQKQNARDGYYGEADHWYSRLSGTYKIVSFLHENGLAATAHTLIHKQRS